MSQWKRFGMGLLSDDGEVYIERGAPGEGASKGLTAYMIWFKATSEELVEDEYGAYSTLHYYEPASRLSEISMVKNIDPNPWFVHRNDAMGLQDAKEVVQSVRAND